MDELEQQREHLREQVDREEAELREAVAELKFAVSRPFRIIERLQDNLVPWLLTGVLVGVWLGSPSRNNDES